MGQKPLERRADGIERAIAIENQQVYIGMRQQFAAAVATDGHQAGVGRVDEPVPGIDQDGVDQRAASAHQGIDVGTVAKAFLDARAPFVELVACRLYR